MPTKASFIPEQSLSKLLLCETVHAALECLIEQFGFLSIVEIYRKNDISWNLAAREKNYDFPLSEDKAFVDFVSSYSLPKINFHNGKFEAFKKEKLLNFYIASFIPTHDGSELAIVLSGATEQLETNIQSLISELLPVLSNLYYVQKTKTSLKELSDKYKKQSEELRLHQSLLESVGDAIFYHDEKGRILDVNLQAMVSLGYSRSELLTKRVKDLDVGVNEGLNLSHLLKEQVKPSEPFTLQSVHRRKDGTQFPVEVTISAHDTGNYLAVVRDITDRTRISQELDQTKDFLQSVIDLSEGIIYVYDFKQKKIIKGNEDIEDELGFERGQITNLEDLLGRVDTEASQYIWGLLREVKVSTSNTPVEFENEIADASGYKRWIKTYLRVYDRDKEGKPISIIATATDITRFKELEQKLLINQNKYKALVENSFDAIAVFGSDNHVSYASAATYRMLDYNMGDARDFEISDFIHPEDRVLVKNAWKTIFLNPAKPVTIKEVRVQKKTGGWIWTKATLNNLLHDEFVKGVVVNFIDLTSEMNALTEIHKKEHYYRALVERSFDGVVLYDKKGNLLFASDSAKEILGYGSDIEIPKTAIEFVHPEDVSKPTEAWLRLLERPFESVHVDEYRLIKKDGSSIWVQNTFTNLLDDPNVEGIISNFRDISSKKNTEQTLHRVSNFERVTGLPNRNYLIEQLKQQILKSNESKGQFALVIIDINALNSINTAHGHKVGDAVISKVAEAIKKGVTATDFVAKVGDDEFAILFDNKTTYEISRKTQDILEKFNQLISIRDEKVKVSLNAGISIYPKDAIDSEDLLSFSEIALKNAKQSLEPFAFYKNQDSTNTKYRLELEKELLEAITNDALTVVYQPIVDSFSGRIKCFESLLRWEHPKQGLIPPSLFVKIAEESKTIGRLSEWVITKVVSQIAAWNKLGLYPQVTVNLSPMDIRRKNLSGFILKVLKEYKVKPSSLVLEITESEELLDLTFSVSQMDELNQLGVGIILDDFGTGFSSISHLLSLPIKAAKVDKSFVSKITEDAEEAKNFLLGIINLIQGSGIKAVVEGVETAEQFQIISEMSDVLCQGFLFSETLSGEQATQLLKLKKIDLTQFGITT